MEDDRNRSIARASTFSRMSAVKKELCERVRLKLRPLSIQNQNEWQESFDLERRTLMVFEMIQFVQPLGPGAAEKLLDESMSVRIHLARGIESDAFRHSHSMEEYIRTISWTLTSTRTSLSERPLSSSTNSSEAIGHKLTTNICGSGSSNLAIQINKITSSTSPVQVSGISCATDISSATNNYPDLSECLVERKNWLLKGGPDRSQQAGPGPQKRPATTMSDMNTLVEKRKRNSRTIHLTRQPQIIINAMVSAKRLNSMLLKPLMKLFSCEIESIPFKQAIDAEVLCIPGYNDVVNNLMDLNKIRRKVLCNSYTEPWNFIEDVFSIFDHAWLCNRKTSEMYRCASKLADVFNLEIRPLMRELGYCCGNRYLFSSGPIPCHMKPLCQIEWNGKYYSYDNRHFVCKNCFIAIEGDEVELKYESDSDKTSVLKSEFSLKTNDIKEIEEMVSCIECGRKHHNVCVLHMDVICPKGFVCKNCVVTNGRPAVVNNYTSKSLRKTRLGTFIEDRVNNLLQKMGMENGNVFIRVLSLSEKLVTVQPLINEKYVATGKLHPPFPYRMKTLCAFQEQTSLDDNIKSKKPEVFFFAMQVQEYASECPSPNTGRIYIAYLDSVHFFQPREYRTLVYQEILLGYLDFIKGLGYTTAHLWACPPSIGVDYLFYIHPADQKYPKAKRLQDWYKTLLKKAVSRGVAMNFKDILAYSEEEKFECLTDLPYFEGDHWPTAIEQAITDFEDTKNKRRGCKNKYKPKRNTTSSLLNFDDSSSSILSSIRNYKEQFYVIRLQSNADASRLGPIQDPDPVIYNEVMESRESLLGFARVNHFEFSSLRRARYSTMGILYELHNQDNQCHICGRSMGIGFQCTECMDFKLCTGCFKTRGHKHKMTKALPVPDGDSGIEVDSDFSN